MNIFINAFSWPSQFSQEKLLSLEIFTTAEQVNFSSIYLLVLSRKVSKLGSVRAESFFLSYLIDSAIERTYSRFEMMLCNQRCSGGRGVTRNASSSFLLNISQEGLILDAVGTDGFFPKLAKLSSQPIPDPFSNWCVILYSVTLRAWAFGCSSQIL